MKKSDAPDMSVSMSIKDLMVSILTPQQKKELSDRFMEKILSVIDDAVLPKTKVVNMLIDALDDLLDEPGYDIEEVGLQLVKQIEDKLVQLIKTL